MNGLSIAQPDVTLHLDLEGVIQRVRLSDAVPGEGAKAWLGRPWAETVGEHAGNDVQRMLEDARTKGVSAFRQLAQRFPGGLELPMEYAAVRLGGKAGLLAIGKNLQAVAELRSRLVAAQQAMERDFWKLRNVETRYRLLFDATNEAVLLISAADLRIVEANPMAAHALSPVPKGRPFLAELAPRDRKPVQTMLLRVREIGRAPGVLVHLGRDRRPWLVRASLVTAEPGLVFLVQLAAVGSAKRPVLGGQLPVPVEDLIERLPDGFVVVDREGVILRANRAFLDLTQVGAEAAIKGERLGRWLERPGADQAALIANLHRHGIVRLFLTTVKSEHGIETEVEISAVGDSEADPRYFGLLLRNVGPRLPALDDDGRLGPWPGLLTGQSGKSPLRSLVQDAVGMVERRCIEAALELTSGNRTAAAELLGLSRQSLYVKLDRYGLNGDSATAPERHG